MTDLSETSKERTNEIEELPQFSSTTFYGLLTYNMCWIRVIEEQNRKVMKEAMNVVVIICWRIKQFVSIEEITKETVSRV
jgi:hypothetical protein